MGDWALHVRDRSLGSIFPGFDGVLESWSLHITPRDFVCDPTFLNAIFVDGFEGGDTSSWSEDLGVAKN